MKMKRCFKKMNQRKNFVNQRKDFVNQRKDFVNQRKKSGYLFQSNHSLVLGI